MKASRTTFISDLAGDLKPVRHPGDTTARLLWWLVFAALYSVAIVVATGPFRDDAFTGLISAPAYALEVAFAAAAIGLLGHAALKTAIPDERSWPRHLALPLAACGAWLLVIVWGLVAEPALPASMLDKRAHCSWQTLIFSVPSFALLLWLARGLLPLWPRTTAALAGAGSAALPALLMQLACEYEPAHALAQHLSPIAVLAAIGAVLGPYVLKHRGTAAVGRRAPLER